MATETVQWGEGETAQTFTRDALVSAAVELVPVRHHGQGVARAEVEAVVDALSPEARGAVTAEQVAESATASLDEAAEEWAAEQEYQRTLDREGRTDRADYDV